MKKPLILAALLPLTTLASLPTELTVRGGDSIPCGEEVHNFILRGKALTEDNSSARLRLHADGANGYEVIFRNGPIDGTVKSGSLAHVRNLYRSLAADGDWFDFEIAVREKNVEIKVNGQSVVRYTEPANPWRSPEHAGQRFGRGDFVFHDAKGVVRFKDLALTRLADGALNPLDTMPPVDEQNDRVIRLQQRDFPVIDFHVHLKGGLTREMAHAKSLNYGINYGIVPNLGEGGVGEMFATDASALAYLREVRPLPFLCGAQGEGRRWPLQFAATTFSAFDYLFTDSMTIVDDGVPLRIYRPEEFRLNGRTNEEWVDFLVSQIEKILTNEPVDIYANPTFLPEPLQKDYDKYWTDARINRVLDVLAKYRIALEINPRYCLPSFKIIRMAKARGIKFTFGTNNEKPDFGRLEYALEAVAKCGLTKDDIWFPSMSIRATRKPVPYNHFRE